MIYTFVGSRSAKAHSSLCKGNKGDEAWVDNPTTQAWDAWVRNQWKRVCAGIKDKSRDQTWQNRPLIPALRKAEAGERSSDWCYSVRVCLETNITRQRARQGKRWHGSLSLTLNSKLWFFKRNRTHYQSMLHLNLSWCLAGTMADPSHTTKPRLYQTTCY